HGPVGADVDALPVPGALGVSERSERADGGKHAGQIVGHRRRTWRDGWPIGVTRDVRQATHGRRDAAEAGLLSPWAGLAERRDADHDERRVHAREVVPAEAPALERPGAEVFGQDVRAR